MARCSSVFQSVIPSRARNPELERLRTFSKTDLVPRAEGKRHGPTVLAACFGIEASGRAVREVQRLELLRQWVLLKYLPYYDRYFGVLLL